MNQVHYRCMYCDLYDYTDPDKWHKQKYDSDNGEELAKFFLILYDFTIGHSGNSSDMFTFLLSSLCWRTWSLFHELIK